MSTLVTYNGLQVLSPEPTATGGKAINDNFKMLSTDLATTNPTASQDNTQGFGVGSRWINTTSGAEWVCTNNATGAAVWQTLSGSTGTVTSVALSLPGIFSVSGSPVTTSGTLTATFASQSANTFLAGPSSSSGTPSFRAIADNDLSSTHVLYSNVKNQAISFTDTSTSGSIAGLEVTPTYNQSSGSAANTDLLINRTQTAVGSGNQKLIDAQVGGTSKFSVDSSGNVTGNSFSGAGSSLTSLNASNLGSGAVPVAQLPVFIASGASHAAGIVPDPGSTAGTTRYLREDATWATPSGAALANPSATIGLSVVNGSAATAMRSDGAPALSQSIAPTWTGLHIFGQTLTASSGTDFGLKLTPTYNQTSTASGTDLLINRTQTAVGSGTQRLIDAQVGGTSKFIVDNAGNITSVGSVTAAGATLSGNLALAQNQITGLVVDNESTDPSSPVAGQLYYNTGSGVLKYYNGSAWLTPSTGGGTSFANPTASVGLSTVNGSATTAMRSDAAPSLSQSIAPTWTALHVFSQTLTASSGTNYGLQLTPTYNQTSTAGGTDLLINRTQTAVGSGSQRFVDFQIAGTSKYYVDNKGNVTGNTFQPSVVSVSYSSTVTLDPTAGSVFKIGTLTGNITVSINSGLYDEQMIRVEFVQDSTGSRTLSWGGSNVAFGTTIPNTTLTTTANKTDYVALQWNASASKWRVVGFVQGY